MESGPAKPANGDIGDDAAKAAVEDEVAFVTIEADGGGIPSSNIEYLNPERYNRSRDVQGRRVEVVIMEDVW